MLPNQLELVDVDLIAYFSIIFFKDCEILTQFFYILSAFYFRYKQLKLFLNLITFIKNLQLLAFFLQLDFIFPHFKLNLVLPDRLLS